MDGTEVLAGTPRFRSLRVNLMKSKNPGCSLHLVRTLLPGASAAVHWPIAHLKLDTFGGSFVA